MASFDALEDGAIADFASLRSRVSPVSPVFSVKGDAEEHGGGYCDLENACMYHVEMLNDNARNDKFALAVERAVKHVAAQGDPVVCLELGAGAAALLSLAAARAGATVIAVECEPALAERAQTVVEANGLAGASFVSSMHLLQAP